MNMAPYSIQPYMPQLAYEYNLGVTSKPETIDQKRNIIPIKPGHQIYVKVLPRVVDTTEEFEALTLSQRNCRMPFETDGFIFLTNYTRAACELECASKLAVRTCKCAPWYYPNNQTTYEQEFNFHVPLCDMFGGHCFDTILNDEANYKKCPEECLDGCQETSLTLLPNILPIDLEEACNEGSFHFQHFEKQFNQHFAFQSYKNLVWKNALPNLQDAYRNGSLCRTYMRSYIAFLSIESPTTSVILSVRDKRNSFYDQLGTIGGTLGLFTGMSLLSMVEVMFLMGNIFKQAKAKYYARKYGKRLEFFLPKTAQEVEEIARKKKVAKMESDLNVSIISLFLPECIEYRRILYLY